MPLALRAFLELKAHICPSIRPGEGARWSRRSHVCSGSFTGWPSHRL